MTSSKHVGRPLKFESPEILQEQIKVYFESCFEMKWFDEVKRDEFGKKVKEGNALVEIHVQKKIMIEIPTVSGLAYALKTNRKTLIDYENEVHVNGFREDFSNTIKDAKQFIEQCQEKGLLGGELNAAGTIFSLKNNFDWKDKIETDVNMSGSLETNHKELSTAELIAKQNTLKNIDTSEEPKNEDIIAVIEPIEENVGQSK